MLKGAIFDADGTLLDSMHIWDEVGARYLISKRKVPEEGLYDILFPMTLEESSVYLKERYLLNESPEKIKSEILDIIDDFYRNEVKTKKGVKEFLQHLHKTGVKMIVATTSDKNQLEAAFDRLEIRKYFSDILTCSELQTNKREPTIYLTATEYLGTTPNETAVFEDVLYAVQTAKKAGFITIAVEDIASIKDRDTIKDIADLYIRDFTDPKLNII